jgi:pentatricopeptide repeat domain-containing protein 1
VTEVDESKSIDEEAIDELSLDSSPFDEDETTTEVLRPDEILFNVLVDACINCRQLQLALELFDEMKQESLRGESFIQLDEISFNTIIKGCAQEKRLNQAFKFFAFMKETALKPNDVTYNSMIDVCVRCDQMEKAWSLLQEM